MKILITGGAGFIGLALAKKLLSNDCEVHLVDNFSRGKKDNDLNMLMIKPNLKLFEINLNAENLKIELENDYDCIIHLAAIIGVSNVLERPYEVLTSNVRMLDNIIKFAKTHKKLPHFIFSSTSEVYAGTLKYFNLTIPTPETSPLTITELQSPRTSYMLSKIYGEAMCFQSGLPFTIFRPHNIYGPRMGMNHVIPELLYKAKNLKDGSTLEIFSSDHTRTFCYIDDAVEIITNSIFNKEIYNKVLNLGSTDKEISILELAKIILKVTNKNLLLAPADETHGSPSRRCPDMTETLKIVNSIKFTSLENGITNTYKWYNENIFN